MASKKSKKSNKKGNVKNPDADAKDELWDQAMALREELEQVKKQKYRFQHERDNYMLSWDKAKRRLEQQRAKLRQRLREKEEREKHLQDQIKVVCEQMKHVQLEHHNATSELKIETAASERHTMTQNMRRELELHQKKVYLEAMLQEKISNNDKCISALKLKLNEEIIDEKHRNDCALNQALACHMERCEQIKMEQSENREEKMSQVTAEFEGNVNFQRFIVQQKWEALRKQAEKLKRQHEDNQDWSLKLPEASEEY